MSTTPHSLLLHHLGHDAPTCFGRPSAAAVLAKNRLEPVPWFDQRFCGREPAPHPTVWYYWLDPKTTALSDVLPGIVAEVYRASARPDGRDAATARPDGRYGATEKRWLDPNQAAAALCEAVADPHSAEKALKDFVLFNLGHGRFNWRDAETGAQKLLADPGGPRPAYHEAFMLLLENATGPSGRRLGAVAVVDVDCDSEASEERLYLSVSPDGMVVVHQFYAERFWC